MFMNPREMKIDRNEFVLVPETKRMLTCCALNVSPKGQVSLNKRLMDEIQAHTDSLRLGFACHKEDRRVIILYTTDDPNYSFASGGSKKDIDFSQSLVENGISLPARYIVEWNASANAWVGVLNREREPDALALTLKKTRARKEVKQ